MEVIIKIEDDERTYIVTGFMPDYTEFRVFLKHGEEEYELDISDGYVLIETDDGPIRLGWGKEIVNYQSYDDFLDDIMKLPGCGQCAYYDGYHEMCDFPIPGWAKSVTEDSDRRIVEPYSAEFCGTYSEGGR